MFTFCPLQGAQSESTASQSLLELDGGVKILIDVGWDESFDPEKLRELERQVPTISLVLLTQATVAHIGAFAHCCKHFPQFSRIPVFATKPVIDLGRTLLQDLYASTPLAASTIPRAALAAASYSYAQSRAAEHTRFLLQAPSADEIARYFARIHELKYSQPHQPPLPQQDVPAAGLTITAYNAGRTLGGTLWHIQLGLESIVYGVGWGQYKENVFSGAAWIGGGGSASEVIEQLRKPTALVSSSRCPPVARPGLRDAQLLDTIRRCVARGGTVLLPADSTARVLELAYVLEHAWRRDAARVAAKEPESGTLSAAKLYLAGRTSGSLIRHARTLLEWMNDSIVQEFEAVADGAKQASNAGSSGAGRGNRGAGRGDGGRGDDGKGREAGPFDLRHIRLLERKAQVDRVLAKKNNERGTVILASDASLEWGFSKDILRAIASDSQNLVVLTEVPGTLSDGQTSLARTLWEWWRQGQDDAAAASQAQPDHQQQQPVVRGGGRSLAFQDVQKVALDDDDELALYQQWLATQRQLQATLVQTSGGGGGGGGGGDGGATGPLDAFAGAGGDGGSLDGSSSSSSSSDADDESDNERQGKVLNVSTTIGQASRKKVVLRDEDLGVTILIKRKGHYDFDVRGKKGRERLFPVPVRRKRNDDFGELIRPDEYLRAEEREEDAAAAGGGGGEAAAAADGAPHHAHEEGGLGKKRKWDDVGRATAAAGDRRRGAAGGAAARYDRDNGGDRKRTRGSGRDRRNSGAAGSGGEEDEEKDHRHSDEGSDSGDEDDADDPAAVVAGPCKLALAAGGTVAVQLGIAYVDYSGLHTARNLEMLLPLVEPRKLLLVGGSAAETAAVAAQYRAVVGTLRGVAAGDVDVLTPRVGDAPVDASVDTHAWVVRLADALVKRLKWQTLRGLGIVTLTGELRGGTAAEAAAAATATTTPSLPTLDLATATTAAAMVAAGRQQPLHVGELRLADLRRTMQAAGHTAEFRGEGTLVVDGSVAVRKTSAGRVEVESIGLASDGGPATKVGGTFYAVKQMIYKGLAVVAGG